MFDTVERNHGACRNSVAHFTKFRWAVVLIFLFFTSIIFIETANAEFMSKEWKKLIEKRSCVIYTEAIDLGGLFVGGRGRIVFTWLDRSLIRALGNDADVDESISNGLSYYFSKNKEVTKLIKNRDIFLLSYQALKRWNFKIEDIVINGYCLTLDDILTPSYYRVLGEIAPLKEREKKALEISTEEDEFGIDDFVLHVAVPSMPKKGKVKISYGDDTVEWEIPKK